MSKYKQVRLGDILTIRSSSRVLESDYKEEGVPFLRGGELIKLDKGDVVNKNLFINKDLYCSLKKNTGVPKNGDLLITANGSVGYPYLVNLNYDFYFKDAIIWIKQNKKINNKFIYYIYKSKIILEQIINNTFGSTILNYNLNQARKNLIPLPDLNQQTAIANYLDIQTRKIDKEISLLEQKGEMLNEYKQALIYESVTKGLNKNVSMKDSGIEWIKMIPEHWEVKRVADFFVSPKIITNPGRKDVLSLTLNGVIEKDIESNKGLNPESYDTYQEFKKNDLVFKLIDLANYNTSRVGKVWKNGIMSSAYIRLSPKLNTNVNYFYYQFFDLYRRAIFNMLGGNGVRSAINRSDLLKFKIVIPSTYEEQQDISNYLDEKNSKINNKQILLNKKIELLKEYKKALIYEVVTGKIEIK